MLRKKGREGRKEEGKKETERRKDRKEKKKREEKKESLKSSRLIHLYMIYSEGKSQLNVLRNLWRNYLFFQLKD